MSHSTYRQTWENVKVLLLFYAAACVVYGHAVLHNVFLWDDEEQIIHQADGLMSGSFYTAGNQQGVYYKPLMTLTYALLRALFGLDARWFHAVQLGLFASACYFLTRLLSRYAGGPWPVLAGLIFMLHPLQTEVALYSADLQDVLYFFFGLLAILYPRARYLCLLLSALSKETGLLFIALMPDRKSFGVLVLYSVMRFSSVGFALSGKLQPISICSLHERLMTVPDVLSFYITSLVPTIPRVSSHQWLSTAPHWGALLLFCAVALAVVSRRNLFFGAWWALGMGLHSQILVPLDATVADRWALMPTAALLGLFLPKRWPILGVIFCLVSGWFGYQRSFSWRDGATLYATDLPRSRGAYDIENNLGVELYRQGHIDEAGGHFLASVQLLPTWWTNWNNLGAYFEAHGQLDRALECYQQAVQHGHYYLAYENLAQLLMRIDPMQARVFVDTQAIPLFPASQKLHEIKSILEQQVSADR